MCDIRHPESMTPDERRQEVASILARALISHVRLVRQRTAAGTSPVLEARQKALDLLGGSRLSVAQRPRG